MRKAYASMNEFVEEKKERSRMREAYTAMKSSIRYYTPLVEMSQHAKDP